MSLGTVGVLYDTARPAWRDYTAGAQVDPYDIPDEILNRWIESGPGRPGYQARTGCYCWGYRPAYVPRTLDGVRWSNQQTPWKICATGCPQTPCPSPPPCPGDGPCPEPPPCPVQEQKTCEGPPQGINREKRWLAAAGVGLLILGVYGVRRTMALKRK